MQFDQVSVNKKANVFFDGKCVSHTVTLPSGERKSVGVILPSTLRFDLTTREVMEVVDGTAHVSINGAAEQAFGAGQTLTDGSHGTYTVNGGVAKCETAVVLA